MSPSDSNSPILSRRQFLKLAGVTGSTALVMGSLASLPLASQACRVSQQLPLTLPEPTGPWVIKDFSQITTRNSTLSAKQLHQHVGLYQGYVNKLNAAHTQLTQVTATGRYDDIRTLELNRSYAYNGAVLHDYYFSNLGEDQPKVGELTGQLLERDFGSLARYYDNLLAVGGKMRGWVITGFSHRDNRVYNFGLDAHDAGMPSHICPLVVMDVYEHAYMIDFGTQRSAYLDVFKQSIRWDEVEHRVSHAIKLAHHRAGHVTG